MSTSSATASSGQSHQGIWAQVAPYVAPLVAAPAALIPTFQGFVIKSAQQQGLPIVRVTILEALKGGLEAAPKSGLIVAAQMDAQKAVEEVFLHGSEKEGKKAKPSFAAMLATSSLVGGLFSLPLAIFQGQTMTPKLSPKEAFKAFSLAQAAAITAREASFVFALRVAEPVGELMKEQLGDNKAVGYGSAFMTGVIASLVGHSADTIATRLPKGMKIEPLKLMNGGPIKAVATGAFCVFYKVVKDAVESTAK